MSFRQFCVLVLLGPFLLGFAVVATALYPLFFVIGWLMGVKNVPCVAWEICTLPTREIARAVWRGIETPK